VPLFWREANLGVGMLDPKVFEKSSELTKGGNWKSEDILRKNRKGKEYTIIRRTTKD